MTIRMIICDFSGKRDLVSLIQTLSGQALVSMTYHYAFIPLPVDWDSNIYEMIKKQVSTHLCLLPSDDDKFFFIPPDDPALAVAVYHYMIKQHYSFCVMLNPLQNVLIGLDHP